LHKAEFSLSSFNKIKELGAGSFGVVWLVEEKKKHIKYFKSFVKTVST